MLKINTWMQNIRREVLSNSFEGPTGWFTWLCCSISRVPELPQKNRIANKTVPSFLSLFLFLPLYLCQCHTQSFWPTSATLTPSVGCLCFALARATALRLPARCVRRAWIKHLREFVWTSTRLGSWQASIWGFDQIFTPLQLCSAQYWNQISVWKSAKSHSEDVCCTHLWMLRGVATNRHMGPLTNTPHLFFHATLLMLHHFTLDCCHVLVRFRGIKLAPVTVNGLRWS